MSNPRANSKGGLISKAENWFDGLQTREQKLVFWGVPFTILFVTFMVLVEPLWIETKKKQADSLRLETQSQVTQSSVDELIKQALIDPDLELKQQIVSLNERIAKIDQVFDTELDQLIAPNKMPTLLDELFGHAKQLKLLEMNSIAPQILFSQSEKTKPIYRHGIEIKFEGGFFATRDFLHAAENMGWKLYWQDLSYSVDEFPVATTQLSLFTLSTSEAFISVN